MIHYDPTDATEVLPAGEFQAAISKVEEKVSRAGNEMLKLTVEVFGEKRKAFVYDYVVIPAGTFKLKALARALGQIKAFDAGTFDPDKCVGQTFQVELAIDDSNADFPEKNVIKKYIAANGDTPKPKRKADKPADADDDEGFF